MNGKNKILFSCGDRSADNYLSLILKNLQVLYPNLETIVLGGERSAHFAKKFVEDLVSYDAHGFFCSASTLFKLVSLLKKVEDIIKDGVDAVVLLDYYGFNIKIAKIAKKYNVKVIYYIPPQIWASRRYRIEKIKKYVDYIITIYPFEKELYLQNNIKTEFFGHPLVDIISSDEYPLNKNNIGLFPGSRKQVIKWNLPEMLRIITFYLKNYSKEKKFFIFGFEKYRILYKKIIERHLCKELRDNVEIIYDGKFRSNIYLAVSVSGTNVLENLFYNIPTIVIYKMPTLLYLVLKKIVYVDNISLPNIILGEQIIPEFVQNKIDIKKICSVIDILYEDDNIRKKIIENYEKVKKILSGQKNVSLKVAEKILEYVYGKI